jgi:hypothetical protein
VAQFYDDNNFAKHNNLSILNMADTCEAYFNKKWRMIGIQMALEYTQVTKRCIECHGEVRVHREGGKTSAHFEHKIGFKYCSLGHYYKGGEQKLHPNPPNSPKEIELIPLIPQELIPSKEFIEGYATKILVNSYERDNKAREECLKIYGYLCSVCEINLENVYGAVAKKFIHVHHLRPLSSIKKEYKINPREDLRPVCPNCHAIIHKKSEPYSIKQIKEKMKQPRG